jgi:hypothetical protein
VCVLSFLAAAVTACAPKSVSYKPAVKVEPAAGDRDDSGTGGGAAEEALLSPVPKVEIAVSDPVPVQAAAGQLTELEQAIEQLNFDLVAQLHQSLLRSLWTAPEEALSASPKFKPLRTRADALDRRLAALGGGPSLTLYGDGKRVDTVAPKALESLLGALQWCHDATKSLELSSRGDVAKVRESQGAFRDRVAGAAKLDAAVVRYRGVKPGGDTIDVPHELATCNAWFHQSRMQLDDLPQGVWATAPMVKRCGYVELTFRAMDMGAGKVGQWGRIGDRPGHAFSLDCGRLPRGGTNKLPAELKKLVATQWPTMAKSDSVALVGGLQLIDELGAQWRWATVRIYGRELDVPERACEPAAPNPPSTPSPKAAGAVSPPAGKGGASAAKGASPSTAAGAETALACEASGARAVRAYHQAVHYATRADLYRRQGRPSRCRELLAWAVRAGRTAKELPEPAKRGARPPENLRYLTNGGVFTEAELGEKVEDEVGLAKERSDNVWCDTPDRPAGKGKSGAPAAGTPSTESSNKKGAPAPSGTP